MYSSKDRKSLIKNITQLDKDLTQFRLGEPGSGYSVIDRSEQVQDKLRSIKSQIEELEAKKPAKLKIGEGILILNLNWGQKGVGKLVWINYKTGRASVEIGKEQIICRLIKNLKRA